LKTLICKVDRDRSNGYGIGKMFFITPKLGQSWQNHYWLILYERNSLAKLKTPKYTQNKKKNTPTLPTLHLNSLRHSKTVLFLGNLIWETIK